jgi:hypothetical protein
MRRVAFAALLGALLAAHPATAGEPRVVGRGELVAGRDLASWEVAWTRWIFRFPRRMVNSAGGCLPQPDGPVRFLSGRGSADDHVVSVDCTVPADRYLLLGTPLALCSDVVMPPGYPRTTAGLKRCAREFWAQVADPSPRIVLDGAPLPNGFVVHTPVFRFTIPAHDNAFNLPGVRRARGAVTGRPVMLRPLAPGRHTLIQGIHYRITHNLVVVYNLTVI